MALEHVGERFRDDKEIVLAAIKKVPEMLNYSSERVWKTERII